MFGVWYANCKINTGQSWVDSDIVVHSEDELEIAQSREKISSTESHTVARTAKLMETKVACEQIKQKNKSPKYLNKETRTRKHLLSPNLSQRTSNEDAVTEDMSGDSVKAEEESMDELVRGRAFTTESWKSASTVSSSSENRVRGRREVGGMKPRSATLRARSETLDSLEGKTIRSPHKHDCAAAKGEHIDHNMLLPLSRGGKGTPGQHENLSPLSPKSKALYLADEPVLYPGTYCKKKTKKRTLNFNLFAKK